MESKNSTRKQWLTVIAGAILMLSFGGLYAWSVIVPSLQQFTGASLTSLSAVFSVAVISFTIAMVVGPSFYYRFDASTTTIAIYIIAAVGFMIVAVGKSLWCLGTGYGILFGTASGIGYSMALQSVSSTVISRRGLAIGFVVACYAFGTVLWVPIFTYTIEIFDVSGALIAVAVTFLLIALVVSKLLSVAKVDLSRVNSRFDNSTSYVLRQGCFWLLWGEFFCIAVVGLGMIGHAAGLVAATGGRIEETTIGASLIALTNGLGRLSTGWFCDRLSVKRVLTIIPLLGTIGLIILIFWTSPHTTLLALGLVGYTYGCIASAIPMGIVHYYGVNATSYVFGRIITAWGAASLVGPLLTGWLFDITGGYKVTLIGSVVISITGSLIGTMLPHRSVIAISK